MDKIKAFWDNKYVQRINSIICYALILGLNYKAITSIVSGTEALYETVRSGLLWNGLLYLGISFCIITRINWKKIWNWITFGVLTIACLILLDKTGYRAGSPDLWRWYLSRNMALILFFGAFINACLEKQIVKIKEHNILFYAILVSFAGIIVTKWTNHNDAYIFFIFVIVSLIRMEEKRVYEAVVIFSAAYYLAFIKTFVESLIVSPYQGGRYYGIFTNNGMFGTFTAGVFVVCAIFWLYVFMSRIKRKKLILILLIIAMLPPIVASSLIGARLAVLGELAVAFAIGVIIGIERNHKVFIVLGVICGLGVVGVATLIVTHRFISTEWIQSIADSPSFVLSKIAYWYDRIDRLFIKESRTGVIPAGSFWNIMDAFSSRRVTFLVEYYRDLNLWGHDNLVISPSDYEVLTHPHNTFMAFEHSYGLIFGSVLNMLILMGSVFIGVDLHKRIKNKENVLFAIFALLWMIFGLIVYIFEDYMLNFFTTTVMLLIISESSKRHQCDKV